ncbi:hypothetical protein FHX82_007019 [Amycolatopsis bartoniae]|nr:hypothetical protein [Amycolatopsis bartoniae]
MPPWKHPAAVCQFFVSTACAYFCHKRMIAT